MNSTPASDLAAISVFTATAHEVDTGDTGLLPDLLSRTARDHADATALVFEGEALGYAELEARSNALARHLISLGVGPDTVVAIALERSFEMVIALMAVLKAGGAYLPLDPDYPQDRLEAALKCNRHHRVGSNTKADQVTGKSVRACLKLCVTKCLALKHQRRRIRVVSGRPRQKIGQKIRISLIQLLFGIVER